jgi:hypothetical protein
MSNNSLGCSSRWVADCELRGVWCGISRTKAATVLASIWGSTGERAVAVMNMDVVLWKGNFVIWLTQRGCRTSNLLGCNRYPVLRVTRATICTAPTSLTCDEVPTWKGFLLSYCTYSYSHYTFPSGLVRQFIVCTRARQQSTRIFPS